MAECEDSIPHNQILKLAHINLDVRILVKECPVFGAFYHIEKSVNFLALFKNFFEPFVVFYHWILLINLHKPKLFIIMDAIFAKRIVFVDEFVAGAGRGQFVVRTNNSFH